MIVGSMLSLAILMSLADPAAAVIGGRPANPSDAEPRSRDIFIYTLKSGQSKRDSVLVTNNGDSKETIELYAVDSVLTNTGAFTCKQRVEPREKVGAWINLEQSEVTLDAGESTEVEFDIALPSSVDVGEHNGCIAFEVKGDEGTIDGNVRIRPRTAVRVAATVPGDLKREVAISAYDVAHDQGSGAQTFAMKLKSKGNVSTDVSVKVAMHSMFGVKVYENEGTYPVVANNTFEANFVNDKSLFWGGWYTATGSISYDSDPATFGISDDAKLVTREADSRRIFIVPSPAAVAIYASVVVAVLGVAGYALHRRNEKRDALRNWQNYTIKSGDSIQSLAESRDIGWKKLAKINGIKAPYVLTEGQSVKVPKKIK